MSASARRSSRSRPFAPRTPRSTRTTASTRAVIACSTRRGRILRDNLYGTIEEDVWRRDFTANALYYNIEDFSIWDYVGGVDDARDTVLRLIGDPETRYREDPVRMLRAVRFAAKLDFSLHPDTEAPLHRLAYMLDAVPPARLFDEIAKMMLIGTRVGVVRDCCAACDCSST